MKIGGYHLGFTDDLKHYLDQLDIRDKPIYLSGFSLGANVVLKCLGELKEEAVNKYNIQGAAVCGAPWDLEKNVDCLDAPGFNRLIYSGNFLKTLHLKSKDQLERFCGNDPSTKIFDFPRASTCKSMADFDDAYIAPIYGFESNIDYYRKTSCIYYLDSICVPTYIVNAADDPFFDPEVWPIEKSAAGGGQAPLNLHRTKHGGHLGFLFHTPALHSNNDDVVSSWMPHQLSRFLQHVHIPARLPVPDSAE
jgi:predicted alpha/beta-fold hydrolase